MALLLTGATASARAQSPPPPRQPLAPAGPAADSLAALRLLARLQASARDASLPVRAARAELEAAQARARATGFAAPAFLSAGIAEAPNANLDQGNLRVEVGRAFFTGPRRRAERAVAEAEVRAAGIVVAAVERQVDAVLRRELIRAAGEQLVADRLGAEDALLVSTEEGLRTRFAVGQARYTDVLRLRTERLRVQSERATTVAAARAARFAVASLVDDSLRQTFQAAVDSLARADLAAAWRQLLPETATAESLLATTADVQRAAIAVARARAAGALATAERRPQIEAFAGLQRIGQANNGPALGPSVGVTLSLPFTAARANRAAAAASASEVAAAQAGEQATVARTRANIAAALERYQAARQRLEVFDAALLRGAREEREGALAAYRTNSLTLLELIDFERALARAEIDRIEALIDAADAWADVVTGGSADDAPLTTTGHEGR